MNSLHQPCAAKGSSGESGKGQGVGPAGLSAATLLGAKAELHPQPWGKAGGPVPLKEGGRAERHQGSSYSSVLLRCQENPVPHDSMLGSLCLFGQACWAVSIRWPSGRLWCPQLCASCIRAGQRVNRHLGSQSLLFPNTFNLRCESPGFLL